MGVANTFQDKMFIFYFIQRGEMIMDYTKLLEEKYPIKDWIKSIYGIDLDDFEK